MTEKKQKKKMSGLELSVVIWLAMFLVVGLPGPACAEAGTYKEVTAPEVKSMIEEGKAVLVHVLSDIEYVIQHIPGSINIPITEMKTTNKLPKDKDTPLAFYCMGRR